MLSLTTLALTVTEADERCTAMGYTDWTGADAVKASALLRGQVYVATTYNGRWASEWTEAPDAVKFAIVEAARAELTTLGTLTAALPEKVLTEAGKLGWTPTERRWDFNKNIPPAIGQLLSGLIYAGAGNPGWSWA